MKAFWRTAAIAALMVPLVAGAVLPSRAVQEAREAYLASDFDRALAACAGQTEVEAKLITCLSLFERHKLYRVPDDVKRAKVLFDVLKMDLDLAQLSGLKAYFNAPGHLAGNARAADLLGHVLRRSGTAEDCRIIVRLLGEDIGQDAAHAGFRTLERHLEHVRRYVNGGGTMPEVERALFQDETLIQALADGLANPRTDGPAMDALVAIEEPALASLEKRNDSLPIARAILKIKEAQVRRLKNFPSSTWDSAYGRGDVPAPSAL